MKLALPFKRVVMVTEPKLLAASRFRRVRPFRFETHMRRNLHQGDFTPPALSLGFSPTTAHAISSQQKTRPPHQSAPPRPANDANSAPRPPLRKSRRRSAPSLPQKPISDCSYFPPPKSARVIPSA